MSPPSPRLSAEGWMLIALLSLPWGLSFIFFRLLGPALPSLTVAFARVLIAALALLAWFAIGRRRLDVPWRDFAVLGLLNNAIPFTLFAWAGARLPAGSSAILNATTPIFTALVFHAAGAERMAPHRVVGAVLGFFGVLVLVGPSVLAAGQDLLAQLACIGASVCYGFSALWGRRLRHVAAPSAAAAQCVCSSAILLPFALLVDQPWTLVMPGAGVWLSLLGIGLVSTAGAYVVYFRIVRIAGPANVMLVTLLVPVSTMVMGALFLGEAVTLRAIGGMALIGTGLVAIDGRLLGRFGRAG